MAENIQDLTVDYQEDGQTLVQELDKEILSKGAWTTILFRYRQLDNKTGDFGPDKFVIRRYKKINGQYRPQTKFNISSKKQAKQIIDTLDKWLQESDPERC